jgi:hypothetical protein
MRRSYPVAAEEETAPRSRHPQPASPDMRPSLLVVPLLLAACVPAPQAVPAPEPLPPPPAPDAPPPLPAEAWTAAPGTALRTAGGASVLPHVFMRLEVLHTDTAELMVRCVFCLGQPIGWVPPEAVVRESPMPREAAGLSLAEFAHAVRAAAARRDVDALRAVMARDFVHSLGPAEGGVLEALAAWEREGYRLLDHLPLLMDRGIVAVPGTQVWSAPPEFAGDRRYAGVRTGFRRGPDGWEWAFLVESGR